MFPLPPASDRAGRALLLLLVVLQTIQIALVYRQHGAIYHEAATAASAVVEIAGARSAGP